MMYKHGAFAELAGTTELIAPASAGLIPVYTGIAPVHQLADYTAAVNRPMLISNYPDAVAQVGYNENWQGFDLCEAIGAHFKNQIKPIGPIVLINVLDPATMKTTKKTASVTLVNKTGEIVSDKVILNNIAITGKVLGTDFKAAYSEDGSKVIITDITGLVSPVSVDYYEVDLTKVTKTQVIGGIDANGKKTGLSLVESVYQNFNVVPQILDCPGWSHIKEVADAMKAEAFKINGHWHAFCNTNLLADATVNTIQKAKDWKTTNGYTAATEAPCWPLAKKGSKMFHLSTLATVSMMQQADETDGIPSESPSNKQVDITSLCLSDGTAIEFDQVQANDLNSKGIRTANFFGGRWVLWGPHTGAYEYGKVIDPRDKFDVGKMMLQFVCNDFQLSYAESVDKTLTRSKVEAILNDFQERIDGYVSNGYLTYGKVNFLSSSNSLSDMVEGDFTFDVAVTNAPVGKSLNAIVRWTAKGITAMFGGDTT